MHCATPRCRVEEFRRDRQVERGKPEDQMSATHDVAENAANGPRTIGNLPEWDLTDLYPGRDSPELNRDLSELATAAAAFRTHYQGRVDKLSGGELGAAVAEYERLQELAGR